MKGIMKVGGKQVEVEITNIKPAVDTTVPESVLIKKEAITLRGGTFKMDDAVFAKLFGR